jgi:hypothetical protein
MMHPESDLDTLQEGGDQFGEGGLEKRPGDDNAKGWDTE